jgi:hypothetical protein
MITHTYYTDMSDIAHYPKYIFNTIWQLALFLPLGEFQYSYSSFVIFLMLGLVECVLMKHWASSKLHTNPTDEHHSSH